MPRPDSIVWLPALLCVVRGKERGPWREQPAQPNAIIYCDRVLQWLCRNVLRWDYWRRWTQ